MHFIINTEQQHQHHVGIFPLKENLRKQRIENQKKSKRKTKGNKYIELCNLRKKIKVLLLRN